MLNVEDYVIFTTQYWNKFNKSLIHFFLYYAALVARNLKEIQGCKIVIALTHMRTPNDIRLAKEVEEIDLILGGHGHVSEFIQVNNSYYTLNC